MHAEATAVTRRAGSAPRAVAGLLLIEKVIPQGNGPFAGTLTVFTMLLSRGGGRGRTHRDAHRAHALPCSIEAVPG